MDKLTEQFSDESINKRRGGVFSQLRELFANQRGEAKGEGEALALDLIIFSVGFLFSRAHLLFGAHPIGIALVALIPIGIWPALIGCVIGALSMGLDGIIFAASAIITVFLRAAISCTDRSTDGRIVLFNETLLLRMCAATLGGFVAALYEVLLSGLNEKTILFGLSMILLPPTLTFAFSGFFCEEIVLSDIILGGRDVLSLSGKEQKEKYNAVFFQLSALLLIFFISLSFKSVNIFGISVSYVFSGVVTLLTAKRFGAIRGLVVGFVSSLSVSAVYSVAFALVGLGAGLTFSFGSGYAIVSGGAALCMWGIYSSGLNGLLTVFPEYALAATIASPLFRFVVEIKPKIEERDMGNSSEDMVGTMALSYQNKYSGSLDSLETALSSISNIISSYSSSPTMLSEDEYKEIVTEVAIESCKNCPENELCSRENVRPCIDNAEKIAAKLMDGTKITPDDINTAKEFCHVPKEIAEKINCKAAHAEQEKYDLLKTDASAEEYRLISRLISGARCRDDTERAVDNSMTDALNEIFRENGFDNGTIRVFGERRRHFILAGEDEKGNKITSPELRRDIEKAANVRLDIPEYFRSGKMVLMECGIRRSLSVSVATASAPGDDNEISGDSISTFESSDDYFFSLISDGMGRGQIAKETSQFVIEFLKCALETGGAKDTILHMLNHTVRSRPRECSATVDLFELDLLNAEATFIKSGAACSFVKRNSSIFRIRSQTAPIGLLRTIDTEKIRVEIKPGDYVIMLSDGVADPSEDAPWLLLMLGEPPKENLKEYAEAILSEAKRNTKSNDDMSVIVIRIDSV